MSGNPFLDIFNFAINYNVNTRNIISKIKYKRSANKILKSFKVGDRYIISPFIEWYYSGLQFINHISYTDRLKVIQNMIVNDNNNCISFNIDKNAYNAQMNIFVREKNDPYISLMVNDKCESRQLHLSIACNIDDYLINKAGDHYRIVYDLFNLITEEIYESSKYYLLDIKKKGLNW